MIERSSLKTQIYDYMIKLINDGQLENGVLYTEQKFADQLNVSRTPVREAVLQLAHDDLVTIRPNKGFVIREYTLSEISEYFQVREAIEGFCGIEAAKTRGSRQWARLIERLEELVASEQEIINGSSGDFMTNDTEFHLSIVNYVGNSRMKSIMNDMRSRINRVGVVSFTVVGRKKVTLKEHSLILEAIKGESDINIYKAYSYHFAMCVKAIADSKNIKIT